MRTMLIMFALMAAAGAARADQPAKEQSGSTWQNAREDFAKAYGAVKAGTEKTAVAGKYAIQDLGKGLVRITDKSRQALKQTGSAVEDGWITAKIKGEYAVDQQVKARQIGVTTDHGVVRLSGTVDNEAEAKRAIDIALGTNGVVAVDSDLQYPTGYRRVPAHSPNPPKSR
jgi:hyperosmotically inducible protein